MCGRGEHVGNISPFEMPLLAASRRARSRFRRGRLATNRRAAIERGEEVDAARLVDTGRPVAQIRVRLADWFERALRREQSVRPLACEAIGPFQRQKTVLQVK